MHHFAASMLFGRQRGPALRLDLIDGAATASNVSSVEAWRAL